MKKTQKFLLLLFVLSFFIPYFSYGEDCSIYDEGISELELRIESLKQSKEGAMAAAANYSSQIGIAAQNSVAGAGQQYDAQINQLQGMIIDLKAQKAECLQQNSYSNYNYTAVENEHTANQYLGDALDYISNGLTEFYSDNYSSAISYIKKGISYAQSALDYSTTSQGRNLAYEMLQMGYYGLGLSYCNDKQYNNSFTYFQKALNIGYKSDIQDSYDLCKSKSKTTTTTNKSTSKTLTRDESCQKTYGSNAKASTKEGYCTCKDGYTWNDNGTSCVIKTGSCSKYGPNSYLGTDNRCYCKTGYRWDTEEKTYCITSNESCEQWYGPNSYAGIDDMCYCKEGYTWNIVSSFCISKKEFNKTFSDYKNAAYKFAFKNGITTMDTINKADMNGNLNRIAMAKMIGNYAINILGLTPDTTKICGFPDVSGDLNKQYDNGVTKACQLGLMGQGISQFRPWDNVTRGEFATVLSRLMNRNSDNLDYMNDSDPYYRKHLSYLFDNGVIDKAVNLSYGYENEVRGYVMLMLMRANILETCTTHEFITCMDSDDMNKCVATCKGEW